MDASDPSMSSGGPLESESIVLLLMNPLSYDDDDDVKEQSDGPIG